MTQCSEALTPFGAAMVWVILGGGLIASGLAFPWVLAALGRYWSWVERVTGGDR